VKKKMIIICAVGVLIGLVLTFFLVIANKENKKGQVLFENYNYVVTAIDEHISNHFNEDGYILYEDFSIVMQEAYKHVQGLYQEGVITNYSYEQGDTCIYLEIDNFLDVLYSPPIKDYMSGGDEKAQIVVMEPNASEFQINYLTSGMRWPIDAARTVEDAFDAFYIKDHYTDTWATVESFQNIQPRSLVMFLGHGGYTKKTGSVLFTGTCMYDKTLLEQGKRFFDEELIEKYKHMLDSGAVGINQDGYLYVTAVFFEEYIADNAFEGCFFYLGACNSCTDAYFTQSSLSQSIWDKGARAIICNSKEVLVNYNVKMMDTFFEGMTLKNEKGEYNTISQALAYAKQKHGAYDSWGKGSEVIAFHQDDFNLETFFQLSDEEESKLVVNIPQENEIIDMDDHFESEHQISRNNISVKEVFHYHRGLDKGNAYHTLYSIPEIQSNVWSIQQLNTEIYETYYNNGYVLNVQNWESTYSFPCFLKELVDYDWSINDQYLKLSLYVVRHSAYNKMYPEESKTITYTISLKTADVKKSEKNGVGNFYNECEECNEWLNRPQEKDESETELPEINLKGNWRVDWKYTQEKNNLDRNTMFGHPSQSEMSLQYDGMKFEDANKFSWFVHFEGGKGGYGIYGNEIQYVIELHNGGRIETGKIIHQNINGTSYLVQLIGGYTVYWYKE